MTVSNANPSSIEDPSSPPQWSPPAWTQRRPGRWLAKVDPTGKTIGPSIAAHALVAGSIALAAGFLYVTTLFTVYSLSDQWKVCPPALVPPALDQKSSAGDSPLRLNASQDVARRQHGQGYASDLQEVWSNIDDISGETLPSQKGRLKAQLAQFRVAQITACDIGIFYFAQRNAALTVSTAAGILAFSILAFVSKSGWRATNNVLICAGLTSGLVLFVASSYSQLYGQAVNYENQKTKVVLAANVLNRVASAAANRKLTTADVGPSVDGGPDRDVLVAFSADQMAALIRSLDAQLEVINNLDFRGDSSFADASAKRMGQLLNASDNLTPASR